jgi:hypothetical protein
LAPPLSPGLARDTALRFLGSSFIHRDHSTPDRYEHLAVSSKNLVSEQWHRVVNVSDEEQHKVATPGHPHLKTRVLRKVLEASWRGSGGLMAASDVRPVIHTEHMILKKKVNGTVV